MYQSAAQSSFKEVTALDLQKDVCIFYMQDTEQALFDGFNSAFTNN